MTEFEKYKKALDIACHDHWGCPKDKEITKGCKDKGLMYAKQVDCDSCWQKYFLQQAEQSETKPMTNRQWLESLSDEEFMENGFGDICKHCGNNSNCGGWNAETVCKEGIVKWLKAEHKENKQ